MHIERIISVVAFASTKNLSRNALVPHTFVSSYRGLPSLSLASKSEDTGRLQLMKSSDLQEKMNEDANFQRADDTFQVFWRTDDGVKAFEVKDGEVLRSAALKRGISPHNGKSMLINCRGLGTCGTCAVEVTGLSRSEICPVKPVEKNTKERIRLNFPPHDANNQSPNLRLACQIQVLGDLHVTKRTGFWGENKELASSNEAKLYFGNLEYILDDKSPSS